MFVVGSFFEPEAPPVGQQIMLAKILFDLNTTACFDFVYQPVDGDELHIRLGDDEYRLSFKSYLGDHGGWADDKGGFGDARDQWTVRQGDVRLA